MTKRKKSNMRKQIESRKGINTDRKDTEYMFEKDYESPVPRHPADSLTTDLRQRKFRQVLLRRTKRLTVVVDDCSDIHNATAVMRTCDCFGVQTIHLITQIASFKVNKRISKGAHIYLDVFVHKSIRECYEKLRADGYRIYTSDLSAPVVYDLEEMKAVNKKVPVALVFGCEGFGLPPEATELADGCFKIPMAGFSQSLNLSVSAATSIYTLRADALINDEKGDLTDDEQIERYDSWISRTKGIMDSEADANPEEGVLELFSEEGLN